MQFRGITYVLVADLLDIPEEHRVIWSNFALDSRTIKAAKLKQFAEAKGMWGEVSGTLGANSDADLREGTDSDDKMIGSNANDFLIAGDGDDHLIGGDGFDFLVGNHGNDRINLGDGVFNRAKGGDGDDIVRGGKGMDWAHGNMGNDRIMLKAGNDKGYGGNGDDVLYGGRGRDWLQGAAGNDTLHGGSGHDTLHGGMGEDVLEDRKGRDWLDGGGGNDLLISRSDAGRPDQKLEDFDLTTADLDRWNDRLTGGNGADEFHFIYEMNATDEIAARNLNADGSVNWMMVMRENANPHDHWVDWGGIDKIEDYDYAQGDRIVIEGHTAAVALTLIDLDGNGSKESSFLSVYSDQAAQMMMMGMGGMPMAHDRDFLGGIVVENAIVDLNHIEVLSDSMDARFDFI